MFNYLEDRLGIGAAFRACMSDKRPPAGIGYLRTLGFAAMTVLILQFLSGIALALHYVPTTELAYDSIRAVENDIAWGSFSRSLHHFGASAFVIFTALHMMRVFFTGAYKSPREFTWVTGVVLFMLVLGFGFTGYLLPWDQKAYFATKVGTEIAADTPVVGEMLREILRGGADVGQPTLTRFHVIHVVLLPLGLLGVLGLHLYLIQRHGVAAPGLEVGDEGHKGLPFFPHHTVKEALVGVLVAGVLFWLSATFRAPLEALAEPSDTSYQPRPDWYFLGLFELLKIFTTSRELGTFWVPAIFMTVLALLPFVDRGRHRHFRRRLVVVPLGAVACLTIAGLTLAGMLDVADPSTAESAGAESDEAETDARKAYDGPTLPFPLGYTNLERRGYLLVRRLKCIDCHACVVDGVTYGLEQYDAPHLDDFASESIEEVAGQLEEPGSEDMPAFTNVSPADRLAVGAYVMRLNADAKKARGK